MFTYIKELWRQHWVRKSEPPIWCTGTDGQRYRFACYLKSGTSLWVKDGQIDGFYFTEYKNAFTQTDIPVEVFR